LTNAIKHSKASHIELSSSSVQEEDGSLSYTLTVSDDGTGMDAKPNQRGLGMRIMKNRAAMADAELTVESSSEGTVVRIRFKEQHHG
jgi:signal transduction histidine kinase